MQTKDTVPALSSLSAGKLAILLVLPALLILIVFFCTTISPEVLALQKGELIPGKDFVMFIDGAVYRGMVDNSIEEGLLHHRPWSIRILGPYLISLFPGDKDTGFLLLHVICHYFNMILLVAILIGLQASFASLVLTQLTYAGIFWNIKWSFFVPSYLESFSLFFILALTLLALRKRHLAVFILYTIAIPAKESIVLLAPVLSCLQFSRTSKPPLQPMLKVLSLFVIIWAACMGILDYTIPEISSKYSPEYLIRQIIATYLTTPSKWSGTVFSCLSGLGAIPVVLAVGWKSSIGTLRQYFFLQIYIIVGLVPLICGWDMARYFQLLMLPALVLLTRVFDSWFIQEATSVSKKLMAIWTIVFLTTHYAIGSIFSNFTDTWNFFAELRPIVAKTQLPFFLKSALWIPPLLIASMYVSTKRREKSV